MTDASVEWINVGLTVFNVGIAGFTAWVGYRVWKASTGADLPALSYEFHPAPDGRSGALTLTATNRSDVPWVVEKVMILSPRGADFLIPIMDPSAPAHSPRTLGNTKTRAKKISWEIGPKGSKSNGMVSGSSDTHWHHAGLEFSEGLGGILKIRVSLYSREARTRRSTEIIKIRLSADKATAVS